MCDHRVKKITGVYDKDYIPVAVAWDCTACKTSGATKWMQTTEAERREALLIWMNKLALAGAI